MRLLHTMLRVGDLARSVDFYTNVLGMRVLRTTDRPDQKYSLAFVGYGDEREHAVLELTYNYGVERYDLGTAYGHVAIEVDDAYAMGSRIPVPTAISGDTVKPPEQLSPSDEWGDDVLYGNRDEGEEDHETIVDATASEHR